MEVVEDLIQECNFVRLDVVRGRILIHDKDDKSALIQYATRLLSTAEAMIDE